MKFPVVFVLSIALVQVVPSTLETAKNSDQVNDNQQKYQKILINKRKTHHDTIKRIVGFNNYSKQSEMVKLISDRIFKILAQSLEDLAKAQAHAKDIDMLQYDKDILTNLFMVIENTAFIADMSLFFPRIFHKVYDKKKDWKKSLESSIELSRKSGLVDKETLKGIELMEQELGFVEKDPNYVNPYKTENSNREIKDIKMVVPKKKKEKRKKGPGLSNGHNEL